MAWCPVCKNEYREGITVCADCNVPLVDDLDALNDDEQNFEPLFITKQQDLAEKFTSYLEYSDLHRYTVIEDEENDEYTVCIHPADFETAKKLYRGFAITEAAANASGSCSNTDATDESASDESDSVYEETAYPESELSEEHEEFNPDSDNSIDTFELIQLLNNTEDEADIPAQTYVRKSEKYNDYKSSAYTCLLVGGLGVIFGILNIVGVIGFINSLFSQIIMMTMFGLFLAGGIYMYIHSGTIRSEIDAEAEIENKVTTWLTLNVTSAYINSIKDENLEDEINYLNYCNTIRKSIMEDIPEAPVDMIDALVDEHLSNIE